MKIIRILSWNVNGLRAIRSKGLGQVLSRLKPDIAAFQETKAPIEIVRSIVDEFKQFSCVTAIAEKPGYSGVLTLVRSNLSFREINLNTNMPRFNHLGQEGRIVAIEFADKAYLYNLYFPSGTTGAARQAVKFKFLSAFSRYLHRLPAKMRARCILAGDFNICHRPIDIHHPATAERLRLSGYLPEERAWIDALLDLGFTDVFRSAHPTQRSYTWWTYRAGARSRNLGWRIDYFFSGKDICRAIKDCRIHEDITGSDHCPLTMDLDTGAI